MGKKSLRFFHCSLITLPPSFSPPILIASLDHMTYFLLVAIATTSDTIELLEEPESQFSASSRSLPKSNFHAVTRRVYREKQCNIVVCCFLGCCCYYCTELVSIHRSEEVFDHLQTVSPLLLHSSFDDGNEHDVKAHRRECTATGPENL